MALAAGMYGIAVSVIAIMLSVSGIILGIGYSLDDKRLKEFGREELVQSLINGAIVGALVVAFVPGGFFNQLINSTVGSASVTATCQGFMQANYAICFAYNYLVGISPVTINGTSYPSLADLTFGMLATLSTSYTALALLSSIKIGAGVVSITLSGVLNPLLTQLGYLVNAVTAMVVSIEVQGMLLSFIAAIAIPVLLPVGLVLRSAVVTRRLGGTIIAMAIGLFAIFPTTYLFNAELLNSYSSTITDPSLSLIGSIATGSQDGITAQMAAANQSSSTGMFLLLGALSSSLGGIVSAFQDALKSVANEVAMLIIEVFFLPVFSVILTVVSIREIARMLGSEVNFGKLHI